MDFAFEEDKIDIEIDGDQHFLDDRIVEHDIKRNTILSELGWTIYRIKWSEFKKLDFLSKQLIVNSILDKTFIISNCSYLHTSNYNSDSVYHSKVKSKNIATCIECRTPIYKTSNRCRSCDAKHRAVYKIDWPTPDELLNMVWTYPTIQVANKLGVSDKAIENRLKRWGLSKPPRGYWSKIHYNKLEQQDSNL